MKIPFTNYHIIKSANESDVRQLIELLRLGDVSSDRLSEATYFACMKVLSESIGKLPLQLLKHDSDGGIEKAYNHPFYRVLSSRPNPYMTATHFWSTVEYNRNHYGNAYVWIQGAGSKTSLWLLPSASVQVWIDDRGLFGTENAIWYIYTEPKTGRLFKISHESMLHFKTSASFDGITGLSVREILSASLDGCMKSQAVLNKMYDNGFTAKAVLQYTGNLNDSLTRKFTKKIEDYALGRGGGDAAKTIIPIPVGSTLQPLNVKLADNEFLGIRKYSALQIAAAFGIKPNQINDYEKASYASAEAQQLAFYVDTLLYNLKQYEEEISNKLLTASDVQAGYYPKFNVSVILRADLKTQMDTIVSAVSNGLYTPNEGREFLDKPKKDGGDVLMCNGSNIPVKYIGVQYLQDKQLKGGEKHE